jgi:hypothetical protein
MEYLIFCKNFCKSHNVTSPGTAIKTTVDKSPYERVTNGMNISSHLAEDLDV